ncbi:MAG: XdhC/CoxI family protein [Bacteroidota bacterium]
MKELHPQLQSWVSQDKAFTLARVVRTWGSSPRPMGSGLIISEQLEMHGSISGGCVEGNVAQTSLELLKSGESRLLSYGIANEDAWQMGLSCGGKLDVWVEPFWANTFPDIWAVWSNCIANNRACVLVTKMETSPTYTLITPNGRVVGSPLSEEIIQHSLAAYKNRKHEIVAAKETAYFIQVFPKRDRLFLIGAAHISVHLVKLAQLYDFETIVIDPRGFFTNGTHFSTPPDRIEEAYPEEILQQESLDADAYAVILSHDPKIDDNALQLLLPSDVAYIGALGSRRTHAKRIDRMKAAGFSDAQIERIHGPIGVNIHAKTAAEIALSIMAEIIQVKNS